MEDILVKSLLALAQTNNGNRSNSHHPPTTQSIMMNNNMNGSSPTTRVTTPQASLTTYPSRMRFGVSSLVQPGATSIATADANGASTPGGGSGGGGNGGQGGTGRGKGINYAELDGPDSEDEEYTVRSNNRKKSSASSMGMVPKRGILHDGIVGGDGNSYLGGSMPEDLISAQRAIPTKHRYFTEDQMEERAEQKDVLIPIDIDLDLSTFKIRDSFLWNLREHLITPRSFAQIFCDDLNIPPELWADQVAQQIREQCNAYIGMAEIAVRDHQEERDDVEKDLRVILNLDVQIGVIHLVDRIEWDLSSSLTPELFSTVLVRDLGLSSSAAPLIAHAVHAEILRNKRNCLEMGLVGDTTESLTNKKHRGGARPLEGIWRDWNDAFSFGPRLEVLSLEVIAAQEIERDRARRRVRRDRPIPTARNRRK